MSSTPRGRGHQIPSPCRSKQSKPTLLPLEKPPTAAISTEPSENSKLLTKPIASLTLEKTPNTNSTLQTKASVNTTLPTKPSTSLLIEKPSTSNPTLLTKPSSSSPQNRNLDSITAIRNSLGTTPSAELPFKLKVRSNIKETGIVPFQRSQNKNDGREVSLQEDDPNISIDRLLAQWEDNINKAEQDFEEEELAFERAQARLSDNNNSIRSLLSPTKITRLLDKAKGIISQNHRLSPIKNRKNSL